MNIFADVPLPLSPYRAAPSLPLYRLLRSGPALNQDAREMLSDAGLLQPRPSGGLALGGGVTDCGHPGAESLPGLWITVCTAHRLETGVAHVVDPELKNPSETAALAQSLISDALSPAVEVRSSPNKFTQLVLNEQTAMKTAGRLPAAWRLKGYIMNSAMARWKGEAAALRRALVLRPILRQVTAKPTFGLTMDWADAKVSLFDARMRAADSAFKDLVYVIAYLEHIALWETYLQSASQPTIGMVLRMMADLEKAAEDITDRALEAESKAGQDIVSLLAAELVGDVDGDDAPFVFQGFRDSMFYQSAELLDFRNVKFVYENRCHRDPNELDAHIDTVLKWLFDTVYPKLAPAPKALSAAAKPVVAGGSSTLRLPSLGVAGQAVAPGVASAMVEQADEIVKFKTLFQNVANGDAVVVDNKILPFWARYMRPLPMLALCTRAISSLPATSAGSERNFCAERSRTHVSVLREFTCAHLPKPYPKP
jgi:hypothetical protein